jgi:hypothetical protein
LLSCRARPGDSGLKAEMFSWMGEEAGEEHSDPERRSPAVSRLLGMTSRAGDLLRGRGLAVPVSICAVRWRSVGGIVVNLGTSGWNVLREASR